MHLIQYKKLVPSLYRMFILDTNSALCLIYKHISFMRSKRFGMKHISETPFQIHCANLDELKCRVPKNRNFSFSDSRVNALLLIFSLAHFVIASLHVRSSSSRLMMFINALSVRLPRSTVLVEINLG